VPGDGTHNLFKNMMLFWTGMQREAGDILHEQRNNIQRSAGTLSAMRDMAVACRDVMLKHPDDPEKLGALLDSGWQAKRTLASKVTTGEIDRCYERAKGAGAIGGKITGAGGGGFLLLVAPPDRQAAVRAALPGMVDVHVSYEPRGARLLSVVKG
jgi:D-glycero-alpha-D-manno-heptose-7-phosphate kinase